MSKVFIEDENKNILANANEEPFIVDQIGTDVFVNGQRQDRLDFTSDPQEQLDEKQDKLSQAQLQAIGEVDAVKSIALQNQTNKASKIEVNSLSMCPSQSHIENVIPARNTWSSSPYLFKPSQSGWLSVSIEDPNNSGLQLQSVNTNMISSVAGNAGGIYLNALLPVREGDTIKISCSTKVTIAKSTYTYTKEI